ncbi:MAG TPA: hypothetical protein VIU64_21550 [Polyangia bacterium]
MSNDTTQATPKEASKEPPKEASRAGGPKPNERELEMPLTSEELAQLEKDRQKAIAEDAERSLAYRDKVRGLKALKESAGD